MYTSANQMKKILLGKGYFYQKSFPEYFCLKKLPSPNIVSAKPYSKPYIIFVPKNHCDWRQYSLSNPVFYETAVEEITKPQNWQSILDLINASKNDLIEVTSQYIFKIKPKDNIRKLTLPNWVKFSEKLPPKYSNKYKKMIKVDIQNFYSNIYTHSIEWALNTGVVADKIRNDYPRPNPRTFGDLLDTAMRNQNSQRTNGILTGSLLADIVSEIVLCFVDQLLYLKLKEHCLDLKKIKILRFKDDFRILYNNEEDGATAYKCLSESLRELNLKLNPEKTIFCNDIILSYEREWKSLRRQKKLFLYKFDSKQRVSNEDLIFCLGDIYKYQQDFPYNQVGASLIPELKTKYINKIQAQNIPTIINLAFKICESREGNVTSVFLFFDELISKKIVVKNTFFKELNNYLDNLVKQDLRDLYVMWIYRLCLSHNYDTKFLNNPNNSLLIKHLLSKEKNCSSLFSEATGFSILDKKKIKKLQGLKLTQKEVSPY